MWIRKRSSGLELQFNGAAEAELCDWCGRPLSDEFDEEEAAACCDSPGEYNKFQQQYKGKAEEKDEEDDEEDDDQPTTRKKKKKQRPVVEDDCLASTPRPPEAKCEETKASGTTGGGGGGDQELCEMLRQIFSPTPDAILTPRQAFTRLVVAGWEEPHDELLLDRIGALFNTDPNFTRFKRGRFGLSDKAGFRVDDDARKKDAREEEGNEPREHHEQHQKQQQLRVESPEVDEDYEVRADGDDIICTSKNRNGWNCSQLAKPGSMLCEHHIALNRMRKGRRRRELQQEEEQQESDEESPSPNRKRVRSSRS